MLKKYIGFLAVPFLLTAEVALAQPPAFEDLAERLLPTVVNVSTTAKIEQSAQGLQGLPPLPQLPPGSPFEDFFKEFYDRFQKGAPGGGDQKVSSLGSGFVIDAAKGYIVTNNHVIRDADEIKIILHDDTTLDAKLIGADEKTDIALLQVSPKTPLVAAKWGDSDKTRVGSWVLAIGNPFGLGGTVTAGIVSARQRDINAGPYDDFIQTDASINRGNSGGPMFNPQGEVIGVNTAIFSPSGGSVGIGFAVPSNIAKNVVEQLVKYGKTKRGWLGVRIQEVTPDIAEGLGLGKAEGALISSVTPEGPAEKAGIIAGDVILSFNGQPVDQMRKLPRAVAEAEVGTVAEVELWRKGARKKVTVTLGQLETAEETGLVAKTDANGEVQPPAPVSTDIASLGLSVTPLNDKLRETNGISKTTNGLLVVDVKRGSVAAEKGILAGDIIMEVDQKEVTTAAQLSEKITAAEKAGRSSILLFIERKQDRRFIALKIKK